jgi:hypothetical protein
LAAMLVVDDFVAAFIHFYTYFDNLNWLIMMFVRCA